VAGVLDDDVQLAGVAENRLHRLVGGVLGLHVNLDDPQVEAATLRGVEELLSVGGVAVADTAHAGVDDVTVGGESLGGEVADAGGGTVNQDDGHGSFPSDA